MPEQPSAQPRNREGQPTAVRPSPEGQERTGPPTGQSTTGRKVEGQATPRRPGPDGQETAHGANRANRPNR